MPDSDEGPGRPRDRWVDQAVIHGDTVAALTPTSRHTLSYLLNSARAQVISSSAYRLRLVPEPTISPMV